MSRLWLWMLFIACLLNTISANGERPQIDGETVIRAGEAWTVTITVPDGNAGDQVPVMLLNGLQTLETTLILGTGGVAVWQIPEGEITQAGQSLFVVQSGEEDLRQTLHVLPQEPVIADLFTTANTLPSYGDGSATMMILPRDALGNAASNTSEFQLNVLYPDGEQSFAPFNYHNGLGWLNFRSSGDPGRVRLSVEPDHLSASLELMQVAGSPHTLTLQISPDCVLNDGRDRVALIATVNDIEGNPVTDGTFVNFYWADGEGYGLTIDGEATLRVPAPTSTGFLMYRANSGEAWSNAEFLRIAEDTCTGE